MGKTPKYVYIVNIRKTWKVQWSWGCLYLFFQCVKLSEWVQGTGLLKIWAGGHRVNFLRRHSNRTSSFWCCLQTQRTKTWTKSSLILQRWHKALPHVNTVSFFLNHCNVYIATLPVKAGLEVGTVWLSSDLYVLFFPGGVLHGPGCLQQGWCPKHHGQLWGAQLPPSERILPPVWHGSAKLEWVQAGSPETPGTRTRGHCHNLCTISLCSS